MSMTTAPTNLYWGGTTVHGGLVRPLSANTFRSLVDNYINTPVAISLPRHEFLAKPKPERDEIKDGPYICSCSFKPGTVNRCDANADKLVLAIFDLDEGDEVRRLAEGGEAVSDALHPHPFAAYHTANSTPEAPRLRIMVELVPCDPKLHRRTLRHIMGLLGLPPDFAGSKESKVLSQPMYRPNSFVGEDHGNPVIASRTVGEPLDPTTLPEIEEDTRTYAFVGDADPDLLGLLYLPLRGIAVADIREPLFRIDPDCSYAQWRNIAAGLRHNFTDEGDAEDAFTLFDEWSSTGTKYPGTEKVFRIWSSMKPYARGKAPVTLRSMFRYAMDAGWENTAVATKVKAGVLEWINGCSDADLLLEEGAKHIAQMPFRNDMVEESLVVALRARIKTLSGTQIDKGTIKRQVHNARLTAKAEEYTGDLEPWLRSICFVAPMNVFRNVVNGVEYTPAAFDNTFSIHLMPADADSDPAKAGRPLVLPTQHALNIRNLTRVDGVTYNPSHQGDEPFFEFEGRRYLNEFRRSTIPIEDPRRSARALRLLEELVFPLVGPDHALLFLEYLAFIVQFPGEKLRWAFLCQSAQGAGKGTVGEIMVAALGSPNVRIIAPGAMASDFNSWKTGSQLVILNELYTSGGNRHEAANKLKDAITDDRISVNQKFKDPRVELNRTNYIAFTNYKDCLHIEDTDRRYYPVYSPAQTKDDVSLINDSGIFERIYALIAKSPGAFRHALRTFPIRPSFPVNKAPDNAVKEAMAIDGRNRLMTAILRLIDDGHPYLGPEVIVEEEAELIVREHSRNNYSVAHMLRAMGYSRHGVRVWFDGRGGGKVQFWTNDRRYDPSMGDPADLIRARLDERREEGL